MRNYFLLSQVINHQKTGAALFAMALLGCGCLPLVERPVKSGMVALTFPSTTGWAEADLPASLTDPDAQRALRLIDELLLADGFGPNTNRMGGNAHGFVLGYAKYETNGMRQTSGPDVYLENGQLEIVFTELGNRTGHFTRSTQTVFNSLKKKLEDNFGRSRVLVLKPK